MREDAARYELFMDAGGGRSKVGKVEAEIKRNVRFTTTRVWNDRKKVGMGKSELLCKTVRV